MSDPNTQTMPLSAEEIANVRSAKDCFGCYPPSIYGTHDWTARFMDTIADLTAKLATQKELAEYRLGEWSKDHARAEAAESALLQRDAGWRPIESAPKDEDLLLAVPSAKGKYIVGEGRWKGEGLEEGWWWANTDPGDYYAEKIAVCVGAEPTHWQPLPTPPHSQETQP
jgi:hypothetical protein